MNDQWINPLTDAVDEGPVVWPSPEARDEFVQMSRLVSFYIKPTPEQAEFEARWQAMRKVATPRKDES